MGTKPASDTSFHDLSPERSQARLSSSSGSFSKNSLMGSARGKKPHKLLIQKIVMWLNPNRFTPRHELGSAEKLLLGLNLAHQALKSLLHKLEPLVVSNKSFRAVFYHVSHSLH